MCKTFKTIEDEGYVTSLLQEIRTVMLQIETNDSIYDATDEAKAWLAKQDINNHQILIKGSRGMAMEKLLD